MVGLEKVGSIYINFSDLKKNYITIVPSPLFDFCLSKNKNNCSTRY